MSNSRFLVKLLRWSDSSTSGRTVTFQLPDDTEDHPFKGLETGKRAGQTMEMEVDLLDGDWALRTLDLDVEPAIDSPRPRARDARTDARADAAPEPDPEPEPERSLTPESDREPEREPAPEPDPEPDPGPPPERIRHRRVAITVDGATRIISRFEVERDQDIDEGVDDDHEYPASAEVGDTEEAAAGAVSPVSIAEAALDAGVPPQPTPTIAATGRGGTAPDGLKPMVSFGAAARSAAGDAGPAASSVAGEGAPTETDGGVNDTAGMAPGGGAIGSGTGGVGDAIGLGTADGSGGGAGSDSEIASSGGLVGSEGEADLGLGAGPGDSDGDTGLSTGGSGSGGGAGGDSAPAATGCLGGSDGDTGLGTGAGGDSDFASAGGFGGPDGDTDLNTGGGGAGSGAVGDSEFASRDGLDGCDGGDGVAGDGTDGTATSGAESMGAQAAQVDDGADASNGSRAGEALGPAGDPGTRSGAANGLAPMVTMGAPPDRETGGLRNPPWAGYGNAGTPFDRRNIAARSLDDAAATTFPASITEPGYPDAADEISETVTADAATDKPAAADDLGMMASSALPESAPMSWERDDQIDDGNPDPPEPSLPEPTPPEIPEPSTTDMAPWLRPDIYPGLPPKMPPATPPAMPPAMPPGATPPQSPEQWPPQWPPGWPWPPQMPPDMPPEWMKDWKADFSGSRIEVLGEGLGGGSGASGDGAGEGGEGEDGEEADKKPPVVRRAAELCQSVDNYEAGFFYFMKNEYPDVPHLPPEPEGDWSTDSKATRDRVCFHCETRMLDEIGSAKAAEKKFNELEGRFERAERLR